MRLDVNDEAVAKGLEAYETAFLGRIQGRVAYYSGLIRTKAVDLIKRQDHISSGSLASSIASAVRKAHDQIVGEIGTNIPYAPYVHFGTRPHWPPVAPIRKWVSQQIRRGRITLGPGETVKSRAFLVSRAISRRGTKGTRFLEIALRLNEQKMISDVAGEIGKLNPVG